MWHARTCAKLCDVLMGTVSDYAKILRGNAGLTGPAFSLQKILNTCYPDAIVTGHEFPDGIDEAVARTPEGIVILYRRSLSNGAQRFAVAHAIGHLMFDADAEPDEHGRAGSPDAELRADDFAAELLVPLDVLARHLLIGLRPDAPDQRQIYLDHCDQLAHFFQVESSLIDQRIRQLVASVASG